MRSLIDHARQPVELLERMRLLHLIRQVKSLITEATYYSEIGVNKIDDVGVTGMLPAEAQNMLVTNYPTREIATR
jgi:hypothetical protein